MSYETESRHGWRPSSDTSSGLPCEDESELKLNEISPDHERVRIVSHGSDDWNQDVVASLKAPFQPNQSDLSSVVRDAGYSLELSDIAEDRPPEQSLDLTGLGTQFSPNDVDPPTPNKTGLKNQTPNFLENCIRSMRVPSAERRGLVFLPIDQLERIMTYENIYQELQRAKVHHAVCSITASLCKRGKSSKQRIFAILCMLQMPAQIVEFEQAKIFDGDLPFIFRNNTVYRETCSGSERTEEVILLFQSPSWQPIHLESFEKYQGQLAAPIFKLSWAAGDKVRHFPLNDQLVLPFIHAEDTSTFGELGTTTRREGGTSIVRRVKIHTAHYNTSQETKARKDVYFAVKELNVVSSSDRTHGEKEDRALKRFNEKRDPHLIRLLATYTYEGRFHLIFPWADGNLKDLWMAPSLQLYKSRPDPKTVRWMSIQILGLARALQIIHYCPIDKANIQDWSADEREKPHGRHGDLKPENILWFKREDNDQNESFIGILKIADFGFADFHSKHSRSNVRRSAVGGITDTYKAPEYDVTQRVSPQYDIWSLGCILLQFVVWYLRGWEGVDAFSMARSADSKGALIASDMFFRLEPGGSRGYKARAKTSVADMFESLKDDDACSDYFLELLEYIETDLLRVSNVKRAKIDNIVAKFEKFNAECERVRSYCISRTKEARRTNSGLSEIVEVPNSPDKALVADSPPMPTTISPQCSSESISSRYEINRSKKRHNSLSRVADGEQVRHRSPLATNSPIVTDTAPHNIEAYNRTNTNESPQSTSRVQESDQQPPSMANDTGRGARPSEELKQPALETQEHSPTVLETPNSHNKPPNPLPLEKNISLTPRSPEALNIIDSTSPAVQLGTTPSADEQKSKSPPQPQFSPPAEPKTPIQEIHSAPRTEQTGDVQERKTFRAKWKQLWRQPKKRVHKRVRKLVDWCFGEYGT
ncbi:hypothetical protein BKA66DRAFT_576905 [Pyrenochaeta sp. MPI-SDFR-AT-0127]|nr:hypothetical protein BKA66DRAFT_576905 [Pyrenochaeta sp. MPI-SDFR-AT-0127]